MPTITTRLTIIVTAVIMVSEALGFFTNKGNSHVPVDSEDLVKLVAGRTFRSSEEFGYAKEVALSFDNFGERIQISMEMSSKPQNPGKRYLSPWVHVKFPPSAVGQIGLKPAPADSAAFQEFKRSASMETGGVAGVFKCFVARGSDFKYSIHVCAGGTHSKYCQSVLLK